jgi:hypothetical protein
MPNPGLLRDVIGKDHSGHPTGGSCLPEKEGVAAVAGVYEALVVTDDMRELGDALKSDVIDSKHEREQVPGERTAG